MAFLAEAYKALETLQEERTLVLRQSKLHNPHLREAELKEIDDEIRRIEKYIADLPSD